MIKTHAGDSSPSIHDAHALLAPLRRRLKALSGKELCALAARAELSPATVYALRQPRGRLPDMLTIMKVAVQLGATLTLTVG